MKITLFTAKIKWLFLVLLSNIQIFSQNTAPRPEVIRFAGIFEGSLNKNLDIKMTLSCQNGKITGTYFYISQKKNLKLEGTVDKSNLILNEYSSKGEKTGTFVLNFDDVRPNLLSGKWTSADGKRILSCETAAHFLKLTTVTNYQSGKFKIRVLNRTWAETQDIVAANQDEYFKTAVRIQNFRRIEGLADKYVQEQFNEMLVTGMQEDNLEDIAFPAKKEEAEFGGSEYLTAVVEVLNDNLITISKSGYGMAQGAAYPYSFSSSTTFFMNSGKEVKLTDIFRGNYLVKLNDWMKANYQCKDEITDTDSPNCVEIKDKGEKIPSFSLSKESIIFDFTSSCQFPHATQACDFQEIPYKDLKDIINPTGALAGLLK